MEKIRVSKVKRVFKLERVLKAERVPEGERVSKTERVPEGERVSKTERVPEGGTFAINWNNFKVFNHKRFQIETRIKSETHSGMGTFAQTGIISKYSILSVFKLERLSKKERVPKEERVKQYCYDLKVLNPQRSEKRTRIKKRTRSGGGTFLGSHYYANIQQLHRLMRYVKQFGS